MTVSARYFYLGNADQRDLVVVECDLVPIHKSLAIDSV